jgi:hypothetical protein
MDGRTLFGVVVRTVGFGLAMFDFLQLVLNLVVFVIAAATQPGEAAAAAAQAGGPSIVVSLAGLLIGLFLIRGADRITDFAYPAPRGPRGGAATPAPKPAAPRTTRAKKADPTDEQQT